MALIKSRPKIRLLVPAEVRPGDSILAEVVLDARREVPVESIDVRLNGEERVVVGAGQHRSVHKHPLLALGARLSEGPALPAGSTRLGCRFELPKDTPASYSGTAAAVEYVVVVHAAIPWWPDAKESFALVVKHHAQERQAAHRVYTTHEGGPESREPYLEFTLDNDVILQGDRLAGQVALYNVAYNRYRVLVLSLVGNERLRIPSGDSFAEATRLSARIPVDGAKEGEPFDFAIKLPDTLAPSFDGKLCGLVWTFEIEAKIAWSHNLRASVPLAVLPVGSKRAARARFAAPTIGSPRLLALWEKVASDENLELDRSARVMRGHVGEVTVEVRREHRGADGIHLVATLRYPDLQLDLDGGKASGIRRVIGGGVPLGDASWDRRHYLAGRDAAQVAAFCRAMRDVLVAVEVADIDDEHLVVEQRDAGQTAGPLRRFVSLALGLARLVPSARSNVPAPASMSHALPAWRELARELDGELDVATMGIGGRYQGSGCAVATHWSPKGETLHTEYALDTADALPERFRLTWSEGQLIDGNEGELPEAARALCRKMLVGSHALTVDRARIVLWAEAPLVDARVALARLAELAALSAVLRGVHGPYR